jgi:ribosomal protein S27AE
MRWNLAKPKPEAVLVPPDYVALDVAPDGVLKFFEPLAEKLVALEKRVAYCEKRLGINKDQRNCPKCGKLEHRKGGTSCGVCGAKLT